jgi:plastocyanin
MKYFAWLLILCVFLFSSGCAQDDGTNGELSEMEPIEEPEPEAEPETEPEEEPEPEAEPEAVSVEISGFTYNPATITVPVGTIVTWTNQDTDVHTVTSAGNFDSGNMAQGDVFSYTFNEPGIFDYICTPHPWMEGQVIVE